MKRINKGIADIRIKTLAFFYNAEQDSSNLYELPGTNNF